MAGSRAHTSGWVALIGVAVALGSAGCGDDSEPSRGTDLTAIKCPLEPTGKQVGGVDEYRPADNAFDTSELIGKPVEAAKTAAAEHGCEIVIAMEDGTGQPVPTDLDPARIYVYTEDDVVTEIEGVGGGI
jgi:hypothetical protein